MTGPVTTEALVEALTKTMWEQSHAAVQDASWSVALRIAGHLPDGQIAWSLKNVRSKAAEIVAQHLAPALQQVTAERDARGEVIASLVDELARLRAEGEAKDRALKPFAGLASSWVVQTAAQRDELLTLSNGERMCGIKATAFIDADTPLARAATAREGQADA